MKTRLFDPKRDIINTLNYKKIFNQPLNYFQLLYFSHYKFLNNYEFDTAISELIHRGKLKFKNNCYYLGNTKIKDRDKKYYAAMKTFEKLVFLNDVFKKIPYIKMVAVTGSLASYSFSEEDDVDLFIIVQKNRLWITRLFLVLIFKVLNIYINNKNPEIKICPNFYISDDITAWSQEKRNIYTAHEIVMMQPIYQIEDTYFRFIKENSWVLDFYPNFQISEYELDKNFIKEKSLLDLIDGLIMLLQKLFMGKRSGHEILKVNFIHFNKHDHSQNILDSYNRVEN